MTKDAKAKELLTKEQRTEMDGYRLDLNKQLREHIKEHSDPELTNAYNAIRNRLSRITKFYNYKSVMDEIASKGKKELTDKIQNF
jgi:hypothetical protein